MILNSIFHFYYALCRLNDHIEACAKEAKRMRSEDRNIPLSELDDEQEAKRK